MSGHNAWWRRGVAGLSTLLITGAMTIAAAPSAAAADAPDVTTTVTVTGADATDGLSLEVTGSGYTDLPAGSATDENQGVYVALQDVDTTSYDDINADPSSVPVAFVYKAAIKDGSFTAELPAKGRDGSVTPILPADLNADDDYKIVVWAAHGTITDATLLDTVPVTFTDEQKAALFDASTDETETDETETDETETDETTTQAPEETSETTSDSSKPTETTPTSTTEQVQCTVKEIAAKSGTPALNWGVKSSFVTYVEGGIAQGNVIAKNGAARTGNSFTWGSGSGTVESSGIDVNFPGSVEFTGHDGALDTTLFNVRVQADSSGSGTLIVDADSHTMDGEDVSGTGITFATLNFSDVSADGGNATATLTSAGSTVLSGFYEAGEALDAVTVSVTGAQAATTEQICVDAEGNRVNPDGSAYNGPNLSKTGPAHVPAMVTIAMVLLVIGAAFIMISRRRTAVRSH